MKSIEIKNIMRKQSAKTAIIMILLAALIFSCTGCSKEMVGSGSKTEENSEAFEENVSDTETFTQKKVSVNYNKIPDLYYSFLSDEEIALYNNTVTAWLNYEPYVECDKKIPLTNLWGLMQECFLVVYGDFNEDIGFDLRDNKLYFPYQTTSKEEHDAIIAAFEARVRYFFEDIDESAKGVDLARHLYINFNKTLAYSYDVIDSQIYTFENTSGYTALMRGEGICSSFGKAYSFLARQAGFEAFSISGYNHGWSSIKIGEKYYFADPTWDYENDPDDYNYFLFGLDKREADGFREKDMFLCCNGDNKMSDYVKIERTDHSDDRS